MGGLIQVLTGARFLTDELKGEVPELFTFMASQESQMKQSPMRGMIETKSDLLNLFLDVLTTDMPFRNFTLRLYTRMLKMEDNPAANLRLNEAQQQ